MENSSVDILLSHSVSWLEDSGPDDDIAISSRIRLARNLSGVSFPVNMNEAERDHVAGAVKLVIDSGKLLGETTTFDIGSLSELDRYFLFERRLISRDFCVGRPGSLLMINDNESFGVMVNEEDHIRLQVMDAGFCFPEIWDRINRVDYKLGRELTLAFDDHLGYLTSCPTNVGTGMRASVMLHLPALTLIGQINSVIQGVNKLGLAVRGIYGEGSNSTGNLYQFSNQSTLGESEEQIIKRIETIIRQIINHEKNARSKLLEGRRNFLLDNIGRAYGALRYSYMLSSNEAINSLSSLRMGVDMDMFGSINIHLVNELFLSMQSAHLQKIAGKDLDSEERSALRAEITREKLKN